MKIRHGINWKKFGSYIAHGSGTILMCVALVNPALAGQRNSKPDFCSRTADAAALACKHEVKDDYWIAIGNCNNLADAGERAQCAKNAKLAMRESEAECGEQHEARLEVCEAVGEAPYDPQIDPAMFVDPARIGTSIAPNPYLPLVPGQKRVYRELDGDETITVTVTTETREILGVKCAVVHDVVEQDGSIIEDTVDWFAQDIYGNVWYFGEIAQDYENGLLVSLDGSWTAGVDGAKAGILMKALPVIGETYRQEFFLGDAEDLAEVLSLTGSAVVPATSCNGNCLITRDFTPIDPDANEHKYYQPGVGLILEVNPENGKRVELVEIKN